MERPRRGLTKMNGRGHRADTAAIWAELEDVMADSATRKPAKPEMRQPSNTAGAKSRDIPDESKERHTEIAVEAGNKGMHRQPKK